MLHNRWQGSNSETTFSFKFSHSQKLAPQWERTVNLLTGVWRTLNRAERKKIMQKVQVEKPILPQTQQGGFTLTDGYLIACLFRRLRVQTLSLTPPAGTERRLLDPNGPSAGWNNTELWIHLDKVKGGWFREALSHCHQYALLLRAHFWLWCLAYPSAPGF